VSPPAAERSGGPNLRRGAPASAPPLNRHVASRLRLRRLEVGMTQVMLAHALGISFQLFQKYEGAVNRISAGALYQLSLTLEVPVQYFFEGLRRRRRRS
jgi:transcriptional regulator with XRE-family HTH domain